MGMGWRGREGGKRDMHGGRCWGCLERGGGLVFVWLGSEVGKIVGC